MSTFADDPATFAYRLGRVEVSVERKADQDEVNAIAAAVEKIGDRITFFLITVIGCTLTLTGAMVGVLLALPHK